MRRRDFLQFRYRHRAYSHLMLRILILEHGMTHASANIEQRNPLMVLFLLLTLI